MPLQKTTPQAIIRESIRVFRRQGYYRTNMRDLAAATGLTKGAFYHHFSNKEEVMRQALRMSIGWFEERIFSLAYEKDKSAKERLENMSVLAFRAFTEEAGGCFFANTVLETAHVEDTFLEEIRSFFQHWERALVGVYSQKYADEELQNVVQQVIADIEGSIILMQLHRDPTLVQRAFDRALEKI